MADTLQVLVVDDEPNMRLGMCRALANFVVRIPEFDGEIAFEAEAVETGEAALDYLDGHPVDLLLLDHKLPGIQGLEVLQRVTEQKRDLEVVMVTAYASIATAVSAGKQGAFDFLAKPFTPKELRDTVQKAAAHLVVQRKARALARERHQMRFQLISVVAHELKSPLNAIDSYLNLMHDPNLDIDEAKLKHVIGRCSSRLDGMRKLINDLLDLTRIESGQKQRTFTELDLTRIAATAIEDARESGKQQNITIHAEMPDTLEMVADEGELLIILNNLLSNAVKYNKPNGEVRLTIADEGELVRIVVADTGIGMTPEEASRLFNEFVRIINSKTRRIPGSGLGLSILKKLATLYGGDVKLESEPDVGTTFTVTLQKHAEPVDPLDHSDLVE